MKKKINILISAVLILLILPVQFACNKDKLLQQEIEEQAITNEQMPDDLTPPPLPTTSPDGNPFDPDARIIDDDISSALKGSVPGEVLDIYIKDNNGGTVDSWDMEMKHFIKVSNGNRTCHDHYYSYQYYKRNNGNWFYKGTYNNYGGIVGGSTTSLCSWDVSFREDDVIQTYTWVYDYPGGTWHGAWGPTYTIENPEAPNPYFEFVLDEMINYAVGGIFFGFGIPWTQIAGWFSSGGLYNEIATITVVDQDGNPLHAVAYSCIFDPDPTFLGSVVKDNADYSLIQTVRCLEPNGPESYDNNLYGREVVVNAHTPYLDNEDGYWGPDAHMPVITVTFNTDGTTTVDYPSRSSNVWGTEDGNTDDVFGDDWNTQTLDVFLDYEPVLTDNIVIDFKARITQIGSRWDFDFFGNYISINGIGGYCGNLHTWTPPSVRGNEFAWYVLILPADINSDGEVDWISGSNSLQIDTWSRINSWVSKTGVDILKIRQ